jgi:UDP-N-acetylmuramoyl-L-alanyl-D-glutamate--2,6-diaminopimelate ligase
MKLDNLLKAIQTVKVVGSMDKEIVGVNIDSRLISHGHLFMAMRGTQADGHAYIPSAIGKGATAVLCEELAMPNLKEEVTYIVVEDSEDAVGKVATMFYGDPTSTNETGRSYWYERQDDNRYACCIICSASLAIRRG